MTKTSSPQITTIKPEDGRRKPRPGPEEQSRTIVDAAVALFLEQGVRSTSIMQVCDRADVSRSTFYRCFGDIDSLLQYIYSVSVFEPVEQFMQVTISQPETTPDKLRATLGDMYEAIFEKGDYAELLFRESNDPNSPAYQIVNDAFDKIIKSLQNRLPPSDDKQVDTIYLKSVLNACQWIAHDAIRKGLTPKRKKDAKEAAWKLVEKGMGLG